MALDDTSLVEEINEVLGQGALPVHVEWTAQIQLPAGTLPSDNDIIVPYRVLGIDINRDYDANYCDEIFVDVAMGLGTFQQIIVPNASNLLITLFRRPVLEGTDAPDLNQDIDQQAYRATLKAQSSMAVEGSTTYATNITEGNLTGMVKVTFQMVDLAIEQTRMQSFGTVFRQTTAGDAIKYAVTKIAQGLDVDDDHRIKGVDMVEPNNTTVYTNVSIPHAIRAVDIPRYLAHHTGAPYSAGFGAYLQKSIWFLYPLFDLQRYDNAQQTLTVINVPKNRLPQTDRSYRVTANQVIVLATEATKHVDVSEALQLSLGNGTRYADASKTFDSFADVKDNVATAQRVKNANEYVAEDRPTGFNNVQLSNRRITSNTFAEMSKLAPRLGSILMVSWVNSDPSLVFPGMPVQYMYEVDGQVYTLKGQVIRSQTQHAQIRPGLYPGPHRSTTALTLFVEKALEWNNTDSDQPATS